MHLHIKLNLNVITGAVKLAIKTSAPANYPGALQQSAFVLHDDLTEHLKGSAKERRGFWIIVRSGKKVQDTITQFH